VTACFEHPYRILSVALGWFLTRKQEQGRCAGLSDSGLPRRFPQAVQGARVVQVSCQGRTNFSGKHFRMFLEEVQYWVLAMLGICIQRAR